MQSDYRRPYIRDSRWEIRNLIFRGMLGTGGDELFAAFVRAEMEGFPGA